MSHEDSTREELFADPDEVVTFAQAYYATEFPHGERSNCPPVEALRAAACSGTLPDANVRAHLFKCSECFRAYRSARMGQRPQAVTRNTWWPGLSAALSGLSARPATFMVGALCLLLFGFIAVALVWHARIETPSVALNDSRPEQAVRPTPPLIAPPAVPGATGEPKPMAPAGRMSLMQTAQLRRPKATTRISRTLSPLPLVEINLKEDGLLRDGGESGGRQHAIELARERQRLRLRLPEGSGGGRYTVTVVDAFGKPLVTTTGNSNGKTLTVDLDLRSLDMRQYRLCMARSGEAPDCYLLAISEQTRHAVK